MLVPKTKWPTRKDNGVVEIKKDEYATLYYSVNLIRLAVLVKIFEH